MKATQNFPNAATSRDIEAVDIERTKPITSDDIDDLEVRSLQRALDEFCSDTRSRFERRFPGMSYDSAQYDFKKDSGTTDKKGRKLSLQTLHGTKVLSCKPDLVEDALRDLPLSFHRGARAVLANRVLLGQRKTTQGIENGLRLLKHLQSIPEADRPTELGELTAKHLRHIERCVLTSCLSEELHKALKRNEQLIDHLLVDGVEQRGVDGANSRNCLMALYESVNLLGARGALVLMDTRPSHEVSDLLKLIMKQQSESFRQKKGAELEPGIAALSEAITAMADEDPRLTSIQNAALCVMGLEMCAPSRINEILTLSIHDRLFSVDAYEVEPVGEPSIGESPEPSNSDDSEATKRVRRVLYRCHAAVKEASQPTPMDTLPNTILMKGSKGGVWGAKPVLDFMLTMFNECFDRLLAMSKRSRLLLEHYERYPDELYLPRELEHYRGKALNRIQIGRILLLNGNLGHSPDEVEAENKRAKVAAQHVCRELKRAGLQFRLSDRPEAASRVVEDRVALGMKKQDPKTEYAEWSSIESELLRRVRAAIDTIPWVSEGVRYQGRLSSMLMLNDHQDRKAPYLPGALNQSEVAKRLKSTSAGKSPRAQTVFEALGTKMSILSSKGNRNDLGKGTGLEVEYIPAYCRTHDPRRWLTTMALRHGGPQLTRLMINMWANRADVGQLRHYDYQRPEDKADRAVVEVPEELKDVEGLNEAKDVSAALTAEMAGEFGLKTQMMRVGTHAVHATTMDAIHAASTNQPVAKAGGKVIIIRPTPYGCCLLQVHEGGCTNYRGCASGCDDERFVKGHLPTNENVRQEDKRLNDVILAQVRRLILARNREVVYDLPGLDTQIVEMVRQHMSEPEIALRLIEQFHEIKHVIKDAAFRADLESAHVFSEVVKILDNDDYLPGALIHYDNPELNGRPERERSIEAMGGRVAIEQRIEGFIKDRPWLQRDSEQAALAHEAANDDEMDDFSSEDDLDKSND